MKPALGIALAAAAIAACGGQSTADKRAHAISEACASPNAAALGGATKCRATITTLAAHPEKVQAVNDAIAKANAAIAKANAGAP